MKRILFDGTALQSTQKAKFHGGGEYAKYMLNVAMDKGYIFDIVLNPDLYLDEEIRRRIESKKMSIIFANSKHEIYKCIDEGSYDLFYSALPYQYYDYSAKSDFLGVIHGLRSIEIVWDSYKHKYYSNNLLRLIGWLISKSDLVQKRLLRKQFRNLNKLLHLKAAKFITVSNHTKYAILNYFPDVISNKLRVFYSPFEVPITEYSSEADNYEGKPYFLLVSGNRFEKNIFRAIKAFDNLFNARRIENFSVIITGADNLPFEHEIQNKDKFILLPYVDNDELIHLYQNAFCFVYPSLNEGFGYPPLLAMSLSTPVIASSATSIPEVCGDAALYCIPHNIDELSNRILQISDNCELRESLVKKGLERVSKLQEKQKADIDDCLKTIFE